MNQEHPSKPSNFVDLFSLDSDDDDVAVSDKSHQGGESGGREESSARGESDADGGGGLLSTEARRKSARTEQRRKLIAQKSPVHDLEASSQKDVKKTLSKKPPIKMYTRVYANWEGTWYYGSIIGFSRRESNGSVKTYYHVLYDDGDERDDIPRKEITTIDEKPALFEEKGPNPQLAKRRREIENAENKKRKNDHLSLKSGGKNASSNVQSKDDIIVGSRVYAKFTDGQFYWGNVTRIDGQGPYRRCSVEYDDGDKSDDVCVFDEVYLHEDAEDNDKDYEDLERKRCGGCDLCTAPDCGECASCTWNSGSTSNSKRCCMFKVCLLLGDLRAQKIPGFPGKGWRYYFGRGITNQKPLHPRLGTLIVRPPRVKHIEDEGQRYCSIEKAGSAARMSDDDIALAQSMLYNKLGLKIRTNVDSPLVGEGWCHQWLCYGKPKIIYGKVTSAKRDLLDKSLVFTIEFSMKAISLVPRYMDKSLLPTLKEVDERVCSGGVLLFHEKCCSSSLSRWKNQTKEISPVRWLCPDHVEHSLLAPNEHSNGIRRPKQTMVFRGFKLEFETRASSILQAGLGVWLRCSDVSPLNRNEFRLNEGEAIDIGIYAPLRPQDYKDEVVPLLKNYIFENELEAWSFDRFDITSDKTGKLHEGAKSNPLVYVNETDGKATADIYAENDPEGSVHYLLGHKERGAGPLVFKTDMWNEVFIDYGHSYEAVRVRKGYSRLSGEEFQEMKKKVSNDVADTLRDIGNYSVLDCQSAAQFIAKMNFTSTQAIEAIRTLILALRLYQRLTAVDEEFSSFEVEQANSFCDNGYTTVFSSAFSLVKEQCERLLELELISLSTDKLRSAITESDACLFYVCQLIGRLKDEDVRALSATDLHEEMKKAVILDTSMDQENIGCF